MSSSESGRTQFMSVPGSVIRISEKMSLSNNISWLCISLATENCDYNNLKDKLLGYQIVVRIKDIASSREALV